MHDVSDSERQAQQYLKQKQCFLTPKAVIIYLKLSQAGYLLFNARSL